MEKTLLHVPKMYADHHVKAVRDALLQLDGKISVPEFKETIELAKKACEDVLKVQMDALKNVTEERNE